MPKSLIATHYGAPLSAPLSPRPVHLVVHAGCLHKYQVPHDDLPVTVRASTLDGVLQTSERGHCADLGQGRRSKGGTQAFQDETGQAGMEHGMAYTTPETNEDRFDSERFGRELLESSSSVDMSD